MIPAKLKEYLDSLKGKSISISEEEVIKFQQMITETPDIYCYAVDYIDRWERKSNEFSVATAYHTAIMSGKFKDLPLSEKYGSYYKRICDEADFMSQRLKELLDLREKK
jgi:hypothetical protein